jgi:hypothetical protein
MKERERHTKMKIDEHDGFLYNVVHYSGYNGKATNDVDEEFS